MPGRSRFKAIKMENLIKGSQSTLPEQKPAAKRAGLSKKETIQLRAVTRDVAANRKRRNYFFYQRGRTKIEYEGNPEKVIRLAMVDNIGRWIVRLLIAGLSIYFSHATAKKVFGKTNTSGPEKDRNEYRIQR
jgi:hypothetical protein